MAQWLLLLLLAVMISPKRDNAHDALAVQLASAKSSSTGWTVAVLCAAPEADIKQGGALARLHPERQALLGPADAACLSD